MASQRPAGAIPLPARHWHFSPSFRILPLSLPPFSLSFILSPCMSHPCEPSCAPSLELSPELTLSRLSPDFHWAVPSWVQPGSVAENCRFLQGRVPEVALCFFETAACLRYTADDLPEAGLPLGYHVHLPLDLPWHREDPLPQAHSLLDEAELCAGICLELVRKIRSLAPRCAVIHPPARPADQAWLQMRHFRHVLAEALLRDGWSLPLCWENTRHNSLQEVLGHAPLLPEGSGLCLDFGHLLRYHHAALLEEAILAQASMIHWNLVDERGRHLPVSTLADRERKLAEHIMARVPATCVHVLEVFSWQGVCASLPCVHELWCAARG